MASEMIDIKENRIVDLDHELLSILLYDHSSERNIIWATDNYDNLGEGYKFNDEITIPKITDKNGEIIQPRVKKSSEEKLKRIKQKGEVFTPSWICNAQNNIIDRQWFNKEKIFNIEKEKIWKTIKKKVDFKESGKTWKDYILSKRLEVSCGEAPYIVSRYDTVSGKTIHLEDRIGFLDRKFRIINENCDDTEWIEWSLNAIKSVYAYDWQGDNVLLARENLLYTYVDYYRAKFGKKPNIDLMREVATIVSWNIWQMDGLKFVIPESCKDEQIYDYTIFGETVLNIQCKGCKDNNYKVHNGIKCIVMDWEENKARKFTSLFRSDKNGKHKINK